MLAACLLIGLGAPARAADVVRGEATFSAGGGFARLVIKLGEDVPSEVTTAGSILIIRFDRAVDVPVDRVPEGAPDYVNSARRDPDGSAIRLSLARRVTVNTMNAGERTFIDLLPEGWKGPPPSLPMDVVKELAERARVAERALRAQRAAAETKKRPQIRVRASVQPTFVRFVFEMPDGVGVSSVLNEQKLTLAFNAGLNFDLADAVVAAPPNVASIKQKADIDQTSVEIALIGDSDVHSFRDEKNYVVDISFQPDKGKTAATAEAVIAQAKPAAQGHGPAPEKPAAEKPKEVHREIAPPTSETIAREARDRSQDRSQARGEAGSSGGDAAGRSTEAGAGARGRSTACRGTAQGRAEACGAGNGSCGRARQARGVRSAQGGREGGCERAGQGQRQGRTCRGAGRAAAHRGQRRCRAATATACA